MNIFIVNKKYIKYAAAAIGKMSETRKVLTV